MFDLPTDAAPQFLVKLTFHPQKMGVSCTKCDFIHDVPTTNFHSKKLIPWQVHSSSFYGRLLPGVLLHSVAATASFSLTEAPVWETEHEHGNYSQIFVPWGEKELTQTRWTVVERNLFQMFLYILPKAWRLERNDKFDHHYEIVLPRSSYFINCTLNGE